MSMPPIVRHNACNGSMECYENRCRVCAIAMSRRLRALPRTELAKVFDVLSYNTPPRGCWNPIASQTMATPPLHPRPITPLKATTALSSASPRDNGRSMHPRRLSFSDPDLVRCGMCGGSILSIPMCTCRRNCEEEGN